MSGAAKAGFTVSFMRDDPPGSQYPDGYWYAATNDGAFDGCGATAENAMGDLINQLADYAAAVSAEREDGR